jgi:hypothetical protein
MQQFLPNQRIKESSNGHSAVTSIHFTQNTHNETITPTNPYNMKYYLMNLDLKIGWILAPIVAFVDKYIYSDWEFFSSVVIVVLINSFFGLIRHYKTGTLNPDKFFTIFYKLLTYLLLLIAFKAIVHFKINGETNTIFGWLDYGIYASIMIAEAKTLLENTAALGIFVAPKWIISKFEMFDKEGKMTAQDTATKTIDNQTNSNGNIN